MCLSIQYITKTDNIIDVHTEIILSFVKYNNNNINIAVVIKKIKVKYGPKSLSEYRFLYLILYSYILYK